MPDRPAAVFSHFGICTDDFDGSVRFYRELLGFELEYEGDAAEPFDRLTELPGLRIHLGAMSKGNTRIELLSYDHPAPIGERERRAMNQLGMTHMAIAVEDIDAVAARIEDLGGTVYPHTRVEAPDG